MTKVILLAAGVGGRFGRRTKKTPKCLIPLGKNGQNLLRRYLDSFRQLRLCHVVIVVGHQKEMIQKECAKYGHGLRIKFLVNPQFRKGSIVSLRRASGELSSDCLIMDADVYFRTAALKKLLKARQSAFLIDSRSKSSGEEMMLMSKNGRACRISKTVDPSLKILGEATGFLKLRTRDAGLLAVVLKKMVRAGHTQVEYEESYNELMKKRKLGYKTISGFWSEMDFEEDLGVILRNDTLPAFSAVRAIFRPTRNDESPPPPG